MRTTTALLGAVVLMLAGAFFVSDAVAQQPAAAKDKVLRGDAKCTTCHDENWPKPILSIGQTKHGVRGDERTPTCTSCHGESEGHLANPGAAKPDRMFTKHADTPAEQRSEACISCHKGTARTHWEGSPHQVNQVACTDCHQIHSAVDKVREKKTQPEVCFTCHREQRADSFKISHHPIREGKVVCSDCHNPHGSPGPSLVKKNTINETCWTCHADKRGPFLWEHQPAVEACTNCHTPHGSNLSPLLTSRAPWLCQQCHDGQHSSENPIGPNAASNQFTLKPGVLPSNQTAGRACLNCHSQVHGSNSPNGGYLQR